LAVSYGIIEAHGGDIEVASHVGEGATFTVSLPSQPRPAAERPLPELARKE
jgi:signal transduction histidine kinase